MPENEDTILDNALAPKKVTGDEGSAEQHPIPDQIAADKYKSAKSASGRGGLRGISFVKIIPPGNG
jgi:hypothetical protein